LVRAARGPRPAQTDNESEQEGGER
jgi:hypothetical protein